MLRMRLAAVAGAVAVLGMFSAPAAFADLYQPPALQIDAHPNTLHGAGNVSGSATSDVPCDSWHVTNDFNGQEEFGSGTSVGFSFSFPAVDDPTPVVINAHCSIEDPFEGDVSETILLLPEDDNGDGDGDGKDHKGALPDTGGPGQAVIGTGMILLLTGGGVAYASRRRNEDTA